MDKQIITFSANEQNLVRIGGEYHYSSNKVSYIGAHFDLGANWDGFDSVRAVWFTDRINGISTVLDGESNCTVPTEVLKKKDRVFVNLVGSIVSNGELTDRLTTYPAVALAVDSKAKVDSTETAPVTPSQFEQFVSIVQDAVASIKDIVSTTLNADYTLTFVYSDGTSYTTPSIRGERGPQGADGADGTDGNGIASAILNSNYTLTLTFTDGTSYTTPSIRGAQGPKGDPGDVSQAQLDAAVSDLKSDLSQLVYDHAILQDVSYVRIPYSVGQTVVIETSTGENLTNDCKIYACDASKVYLEQTTVSGGSHSHSFVSSIDATYLKCSSAPDIPLKVTVIDEDKLVSKVDKLSDDVSALEESTVIKYSMSDVYERKEVSSAYNMYEYMTAEVPTRARAKKEYIQEIPSGATSVDVVISADSLANGKYKVGWAFYTDNYVQISASVKGWYTSNASFTVTIPENAKYFMLYYATNSATEIILDEIDTAKNRIIFNNSAIDYAKAIVNNPVAFEVDSIKDNVEDIESDLIVNADNETFIYSVNHRGYSSDAPENTLPAYIMSKKKGFAYAECDVCFTSDGVAVLLHDSTINRTARNTDGTEISETISIGDITYEQALTYDFGIWKGSQWQGTPIPTFDQFILTCKKLSLHPFIELKDSVNGTYWTDARIASVANSIKNVGMENHVTFISFAVSALQKMSVHFPNARLGLGFEGTYSTENFASYITNAETLISNDREVIATVNYGSMTDELYSMLTTAGIKPLVWTVNTENAVLNLDETVVGVLSDYLNAGKIILNSLIESI